MNPNRIIEGMNDEFWANLREILKEELERRIKLTLGGLRQGNHVEAHYQHGYTDCLKWIVDLPEKLRDRNRKDRKENKA